MSRYWKAIAAALGGANGAILLALSDTVTPGAITKAEALTIVGVALSAGLTTLAAPKNKVADGEV